MLKVGDMAPDFTADALGAGALSLRDVVGSTRVLLKFYRFATCPICNLHMAEVIRRHGELELAGLETVVLFHTPIDELADSVAGELPFTAIADPDKRVFAAYGVEASLSGMASTRVMRDYARALKAGYHSASMSQHGGIKGLPADFIVGIDGKVQYVHYGVNFSDTVPVDEILSVVARLDNPDGDRAKSFAGTR
jgi:peroxiredoxin